jgi:hypothetical protein
MVVQEEAMTRMDTGRTNQTIDQDRRRLLGAPIRADGAKFLELMNTEEAKSRRAARDERYREDARAEWEMNYGRIIGEL